MRGTAISTCTGPATRPRPGRERGTSAWAAGPPRTRPGRRAAARCGSRGRRAPRCGTPPTGRPGEQVHAEGQPARGQLLERRLHVVEAPGGAGCPPVDDHEDVAVPVVGAPFGATRPVGLGGVDAVRAEAPPRAGRAGRAPRASARRTHVGLGARGDGPTCGRRASGPKVPPAEVERRRTAPSGGVVRRARAATRVRSTVLLPLRGAPTTATCPAGAGQVDRERLGALLAGPVHDPDRDLQARQRPPARRDQPEGGVLDQRTEQAVQGLRGVERRQPDLVGAGPVARHPGQRRPRAGVVGRPVPATAVVRRVPVRSPG